MTARVGTESGDAQGWSLREVAAEIGGSGARIASLRSASGESLVVTAADWNDATRIPVIRYNRRGLLKFDWVDAQTHRQLPGGLREVAHLRLQR